MREGCVGEGRPCGGEGKGGGVGEGCVEGRGGIWGRVCEERRGVVVTDVEVS